jgi:hypothetical protein
MNWKKILAVLTLSAVALVLVLLGGGMLLDGTIELQTESTLDAPRDAIQPLISDPAGVMRWWQDAAAEPGHEAIANMTMRAGGGPATGPGATVLFEVDGTLLEEWTLVKSSPPRGAVWDVDFQMFVVRRSLLLEALPTGKTKVSWQETGTFENPLMRWFTLMPTDGVIENFQGALRLLERQAQAELGALQPAPAPGDDDSAAAGDDSAAAGDDDSGARGSE